MFKRNLVRQARLCGARRVASPALLRSSIQLQIKPANKLASLSRFSHYTPLAARAYSTTATAEETHQDEMPSEDQSKKFSSLRSLGVHDNLLKAIIEGMGYEEMTDVQAMTIKPALEGKDVVAQARTGTGKTLGFLLPILQSMIADDATLAHKRRGKIRADDIRAIVVSPTRELAEQIGVEARKLCRYTDIRVQTAVGGTMRNAMLRKTRFEGCDLLIATPGRLYDILSDETSGIDAPMLKALVLDEADRMLDVGFDKELQQILQLLPDRSQVPRQTMLFSATIPKNVVQLARTYVDATNFQFVQTINPDEAPTHERVPQYIVSVKGYENIFPTLLELFHRAQKGEHGPEPFKALVFFSTTAMVQVATEVFRILTKTNRDLPNVYDIHSKKTQSQRTWASDHFRKAKSAILLSSDVTARGMDFPNVSHVIQVGVPPDREQYIHRIGRTGRANKGGQGWLIVSEKDIPSARRALPGLPIQRRDDLDTADVHLAVADESSLPEHFGHVREAMQRVSEQTLHDAYFSMISTVGRGGDIQAAVDQLNDWVEYGWGWEEPPAMSASAVAQRGLSRIHGINIKSNRRGRGSDYTDGPDRRDNFGGNRRRRGGDQFDAMTEERPSRGHDRRRPMSSF